MAWVAMATSGASSHEPAVADGVAGSAVAGSSGGGMMRAMALRVKYRVETEPGRAKRRMAIIRLCCHPENRGGMYPQGDVVKQLAIRIAKQGFNQEEADHQGVCVQEPPAAEVATPAVAETFIQYNQSKCRGSEVLAACFGFDASAASLGMLSHNHLLLVLLCWLNGAEWKLTEEERQILAVGVDGRLDLQAAVAVDNLKELHKTCQEGLMVEVLSWKINVEEPGACALISNALNNTSELALRTTELTALSVLSGECALHSNALNSVRIDFEEIKARLQFTIPGFVAEPEFQEFFECVINLGAHKSSFIPELLRFGSRFVNQKHRQLRLQAFVETNKVNINCPRTKIAALKRAYRKQPSHGYCPTPDAKFHKSPFSMVVKLEELLQYFHVCCKDAVAALGGEHQQEAFLANVDVCAAEAFVAAPEKFSVLDLQSHLLSATQKYHQQLRTAAEEKMPRATDKDLKWVVFEGTEKKKTTSAVADTRVLPKVIQFDETTGLALSSQDQCEKEVQQSQAPQLRMPWQVWHGHACDVMGRQDAAMRSALQVLYMLHTQQVYDDVPIAILVDEGKNHKRVVATKTIPAEGIMLPPCVPKTKTLSVDSVHMYRVPIKVSTITSVPAAVAEGAPRRRIKGKAQDAAVAENSGPIDGEATVPAAAVADSRTTLVSTFYVVPEWSGPKARESDDAGDDPETEWTWTGDESMHPYWAIRRQTEKQTKPEHPSNMMYKELSFTCVTVGTVMGKSMTTTTQVTVPFLTNQVEIPQETELSLHFEEQPQKQKGKNRTWKDQLVEDAKNKKES